MTFFHVLTEGAADVPVVREVLTRRFGLSEDSDFRIHPHKGRGQLRNDLLSPPDPRHQGLLDQLPAKLKGWSNLGADHCIVVLLDADDDPCRELLAELKAMLARLLKRPGNVLFRLAIEETESWFIADLPALEAAYGRKIKLNGLRRLEPDAIVGAWERLAEALGHNLEKQTFSGPDKYRWAESIAPHLNLDNPPSPSLGKLIEGIQRQL